MEFYSVFWAVWDGCIELMKTELNFGFTTMSPLKLFTFFGCANMCADFIRLVSSRSSD